MTIPSPRYAVYFAPEHGSPLDRFGRGVIGYDAYTGRDVPFEPPVLAEVNAVLNASWHPRRYGFHATLKAPMVLAPAQDEAALLAFAAEFARRTTPVTLDGLAVTALGNNFALRPVGDVAALNALAFAIVQAFDPFRAPLTEADRQRRLAGGKLTERQISHLEQWGYHDVGEDFWFHMTLTGPIPPERMAEIEAALAARYRQLELQGRAVIDNVTLFRQDSPETPFAVLQRFPFAG